MAISPEQRAILIERLKKAQEAKRVKAEARKAAAAAPAPPSPPTPKAEAKPPKVEKPKPAPKKVEKEEKREIEEKEEIEIEEPIPTPVVQEIYHRDKKGTFVEITALPYGEPEVLEKMKRSKPIDIPATPKATKDKGYMKLKFYKEPSQKVLKKIMKIHDESSSEEEEEEMLPPPPPPKPQPSQADAKKQHMKELANYYFNYY